MEGQKSLYADLTPSAPMPSQFPPPPVSSNPMDVDSLNAYLTFVFTFDPSPFDILRLTSHLWSVIIHPPPKTSKEPIHTTLHITTVPSSSTKSADPDDLDDGVKCNIVNLFPS